MFRGDLKNVAFYDFFVLFTLRHVRKVIGRPYQNDRWIQRNLQALGLPVIADPEITRLVEPRERLVVDGNREDVKTWEIAAHLAKLKGFRELPYYAVMFEQPVGVNRIKRAAMVSQSPLVIRQWIDSISNPGGGAPHWEALPQPTRSRAIIAAEQWLRSR